jgi:hypothetical protein
MNDANHVTAETDEFTPRVHFLINPNDGSLCLKRGLVSPGRSMAPHNQSDIRSANESLTTQVACHEDGDVRGKQLGLNFFISKRKKKPRRLRSRVLGQGNADTHGGADSDRAAHVQLECVSEQALPPPSQQRQSVNAMAIPEESLFNFR